MLNVHKASKKDTESIIELLKALDLYYPSIPTDNFYVAEENDNILGCVQFKEYDEYYFISSLGVKESSQKAGVSKIIMEFILKEAAKNKNKDIYLYSLIPDYFKKFGFAPVKQISNSTIQLPPKDLYQCDECFPEKCRPMVKKQ